MSPRLIQAALGGLLIVGLLGGTALGVDSCGKGSVIKAEQQANAAHGAADAHQTQAQASDKLVADLQARVASAAQDMDRLQAERAALLRKLAATVPTVPSHPDNAPAVGPVPGPVVDVRDQVIAKDAELIQAQSKVISDQAEVIGTLVVSRDAWKATAEARQREAAGLRIALDAQRSVATSSRWLGRVQGFAIGLGAGFVAGRLR